MKNLDGDKIKFNLPLVKNKLKAPKMKPPKGNEKWEEEFDDEMNVGETEHGFCFLIYSIVKSL